MNIDAPIRDLGSVDFQPLADEVQALDAAAWNATQIRQKVFDVHKATESVVLLFVDLDVWPDIVVTREAGWEPLAESAAPLMDNIIASHFAPGGIIVRAMAAKLLPDASIMPHVDHHPSFHCGHRIHVPLRTHRKVRFSVDGRPHRLQVGNAYEINNQLPHSVMNSGSEDRIHFIFDYVPPTHLVGPGRAIQ